jgi:hypothetical protein
VLACCGVKVVTLTLCIVAISCGAYPETLDGVEDAASDPTELPSDGAAEADDPASWVTGVVVFVNAEIIRVSVGAVVGVVTVVAVVVGVVVVGVVTVVVVGVVTVVVVGVVTVVVVGVVTVVVVVTVVAATATPLAEPGFTTAT